LCACECEFVCVLCVYKCGSALYVSMCDSAGMCLSVCVCVCVSMRVGMCVPACAIVCDGVCVETNVCVL
jgi:hypothetical protein